jgi:hypothetical protein
MPSSDSAPKSGRLGRKGDLLLASTRPNVVSCDCSLQDDDDHDDKEWHIASIYLHLFCFCTVIFWPKALHDLIAWPSRYTRCFYTGTQLWKQTLQKNVFVTWPELADGRTSLVSQTKIVWVFTHFLSREAA